METHRHTILVDQLSYIVIPTETPRERYSQRFESVEEPIEHYTDNDGLIHFQMYASAEASSKIMHFVFHGKHKSIALELRASTEGNETHPLHNPKEPAPKQGKLRPGLTEDEALTLSNEELVKKGFTPRVVMSDGKVSERWLKATMTNATIVEPVAAPRRRTRVPKPRASSFGPVASSTTTRNWCGVEVRDASGYDGVSGWWTVPNMPHDPNAAAYAETAIWVGLDGDQNILPLPQAGVDLTVYNSLLLPGFFQVVPYSWVELYPANPLDASTWGAVPVDIGDSMYVHVWIDSVGNTTDPVIPNGYAHMAVINQTRGEISHPVIPLNGQHFTGAEAEWIVEAPGRSGQLLPLAKFDTFFITDAIAKQKDSSTYDYWANTGDSLQINMVNGSNKTLAFVSPAPPGTIGFLWMGYF